MSAKKFRNRADWLDFEEAREIRNELGEYVESKLDELFPEEADESPVLVNYALERTPVVA